MNEPSFNKRINPYISGLETYICDCMSEAYMEAHARSEDLWADIIIQKARGVPDDALVMAHRNYEGIKDSMEGFMQYHCSYDWEALMDEINE